MQWLICQLDGKCPFLTINITRDGRRYDMR